VVIFASSFRGAKTIGISRNSADITSITSRGFLRVKLSDGEGPEGWAYLGPRSMLYLEIGLQIRSTNVAPKVKRISKGQEDLQRSTNVLEV